MTQKTYMDYTVVDIEASGVNARESHRKYMLEKVIAAADYIVRDGAPRVLFIPADWFHPVTTLNINLEAWLTVELTNRGFTVDVVEGVTIVPSSTSVHTVGSPFNWFPLGDGMPVASAVRATGFKVTWEWGKQ